MPRDIVLGNGSMLVNFDRDLNMRDLYYPIVGLSNHISGHQNKLGVWVGGTFSWINHDWEKKIKYRENTLTSQVEALHEGMGLSLLINDTVHYKKDIYLKKIDITNLTDEKREIRLFLTHDITLYGLGVGDTALYDPAYNCICHYKRNCYLLMNGSTGEEGLYQFTVGTKRFGGAEGTWRDAEDGYLEGNTIAHGLVDSTMSFRINLEGGKTGTVYYWIVAGANIFDVRSNNKFILSREPDQIFAETNSYWKAWLKRKEQNFGGLSESTVALYYRSLLIIRTQTDKGGAILAATDSDVLLTYPDHYNYVWPRDGALISFALDLAGYPEISRKFFRFCEKIITEGGFFLHKYNADGTLGSSWHPWWKDGATQLPIQEDETALVLFALGQHFEIYRDIEFVESLYSTLITKAADFLCAYRDPVNKLPLPSFDLWEERKGIFSFTCSAIHGALSAAGYFAHLLNDKTREEKYEKAATEVQEAMSKYLYSTELGRFVRGVYLAKDGTLEQDITLDSSLYGLFEFGAFSANDARIAATMQAVYDGLWIKTDIGGMARYQNDYYFKKSEDIENVPGNPWVICTLWMAEWIIEKAETLKELESAKKLIDWVEQHALSSGVLPEQIHPYTGDDLSVSPLTWSHSNFVLAVEKYLKKVRSLNASP